MAFEIKYLKLKHQEEQQNTKLISSLGFNLKSHFRKIEQFRKPKAKAHRSLKKREVLEKTEWGNNQRNTSGHVRRVSIDGKRKRSTGIKFQSS